MKGKISSSFVLNHSVNYIILLNTHHCKQHGRCLSAEKVLKKKKITRHLAILTTAVYERRLHQFWAAYIQDLYHSFYVQVLVTVQRDNVTNVTVGCVVFIFNYFHNLYLPVMVLLFYCQISYVQFIQMEPTNYLTLSIHYHPACEICHVPCQQLFYRRLYTHFGFHFNFLFALQLGITSLLSSSSHFHTPLTPLFFLGMA